MEQRIFTYSRNNYSPNSTYSLQHIYFEEVNCLPDTFFVELMDNAGEIDKEVFAAGDCVFGLKNFNKNLNFWLDPDGNLWTTNTSGDEGFYEINSNGDLIYNLYID